MAIFFGSFSSEIHLDILQTLLLSPDCPRPVLCLCSPSLLKFVEHRRGPAVKHFGPLLRQTTLKALGIEGGALSSQIFLRVIFN
jgi:mediator of RNA polymerase II transcription subunit 5